MSDPDGDSIVPCTPTLVPNRPDDSCQAINSPRVPPGQPIRFQFDDVPTGGNFGAVPGGKWDWKSRERSCHRVCMGSIGSVHTTGLNLSFSLLLHTLEY